MIKKKQFLWCVHAIWIYKKRKNLACAWAFYVHAFVSQSRTNGVSQVRRRESSVFLHKYLIDTGSKIVWRGTTTIRAGKQVTAEGEGFKKWMGRKQPKILILVILKKFPQNITGIIQHAVVSYK